MHKQIFKLVAGVLFALALQPAAVAAPGKDDAVQFVKKAVAYIKQNGKDQALAEFNKPTGQFVDGELYIVAMDLNGVLLADGAKPRLVGKSLLEIRDMNGKQFVLAYSSGAALRLTAPEAHLHDPNCTRLGLLRWFRRR